MKRSILIIIILAVVVGVSIWGYAAFSGRKEARLPEGIETQAVRRGKITAVVNATGSVAPEESEDLAFRSSGEIVELVVESGDRVKKGQVLARLDTRALEIAVSQAEAALRIAELQLARLQASPSEEDLAAAQASVDSAEAHLKALLDSPTDRDIELARLSVDQAKNNLWSAQANRDSTAGSPMASAGAIASAKSAVANAEIGVRMAEIQYEKTLEGPSDEAIKAARAQLAQAQASLAKLKEGPSEEDLEIAREQVRQSQLNLDSARLRLEDAVISAPFDGVVADVRVSVGQFAAPSLPAMTIVDLSRFHTDVFIDELDIGKVKVGQEARLELDAFPGREIKGRVTHIDATGTPSQGLITYKVTIDLGSPDLAIKPDMTVSVKIVVAEKQGVLLIPGRAIRRDKEGQYVEVLEGGQLKRTSVELGLSNDRDVEVLSGLEEGQEIVVATARTNIFQMPNR